MAHAPAIPLVDAEAQKAIQDRMALFDWLVECAKPEGYDTEMSNLLNEVNVHIPEIIPYFKSDFDWYGRRTAVFNVIQSLRHMLSVQGGYVHIVRSKLDRARRHMVK